MSLMAYWPLAGLRVRTPRLELRIPDSAELGVLARLAAAGVHDPAVQPFAVPWTDAEPEERARRVLRWHWRCWADWRVDEWTLNFVVLRDGEVVGSQAISAKDFSICSEVHTGSWLGSAHHGRGIGTEMRAAVLELAFARLGAGSAVSAAFEDNLGSQGVSRKLGYEHDGLAMHAVRGKPAVMRRLRLTRVRWEAHRSIPVKVAGLEECLPLFGVPPAS
ncbi:GNAT family N-acetyltransferase [Nocardia sp. BMG111209]|uniref:GNAT family N-acetyltransferase n=1 Tax=Nocardia sp. BMG111209 TaxID=1160137 RepID=UPI0012DFA574|nr:GNAT family N-acetyltransferase [Nocardia sp. BMG111209]